MQRARRDASSNRSARAPFVTPPCPGNGPAGTTPCRNRGRLWWAAPGLQCSTARYPDWPVGCWCRRTGSASLGPADRGAAPTDKAANVCSGGGDSHVARRIHHLYGAVFGRAGRRRRVHFPASAGGFRLPTATGERSLEGGGAHPSPHTVPPPRRPSCHRGTAADGGPRQRHRPRLGPPAGLPPRHCRRARWGTAATPQTETGTASAETGTATPHQPTLESHQPRLVEPQDEYNFLSILLHNKLLIWFFELLAIA